jgi:hypothetical protein
MATSDPVYNTNITYYNQNQIVPEQHRLPFNPNAVAYNGNQWIIGGTNFRVQRKIYTYSDVLVLLGYVNVCNAVIKTLSNIKYSLISKGSSTYQTEIDYVSAQILSKQSYRDLMLSAAAAKYTILKSKSYVVEPYTINTLHTMMISSDGFNWTPIEDNPFELYVQDNTPDTVTTTFTGTITAFDNPTGENGSQTIYLGSTEGFTNLDNFTISGASDAGNNRTNVSKYSIISIGATSIVIAGSFNGVYASGQTATLTQSHTENTAEVAYKSKTCASVNDIKWNKYLSVWVAVGTAATGGIWNGTSWSGSTTASIGPNRTDTYGAITLTDSSGTDYSSGLQGLTTLAISSDGYTWTPCGYAIYGLLNKVAFNNSIAIAINSSNVRSVEGVAVDGVAFYSTDCKTWLPLTGLGSIIPRGLAWNGSMWVIVGENSAASEAFPGDQHQAIKTSTNGTTWTTRYITNNDTYSFGPTSALRIWDVGWNGISWLAVCRNPSNTGGLETAFFRSGDGINWSLVSISPDGQTIVGDTSVTWDGNQWLILEKNRLIFKSDDGSVLTNLNPNNNYLPQSATASAVATNIIPPIEGTTSGTVNSIIVGFGAPSSMIYSYDDTVWIPRLVNGVTNYVGNPTLLFKDVVWTGTKWIAIQDSVSGISTDSITLSTNGLDWSYPTGTNLVLIDRPTSIAYNSSKIVIVGRGNIKVTVSTDSGSTWTNYNSPLSSCSCLACNGKNSSVGISNFADSSNGTQVITVTSTTGISVGEYITIANATNSILNNGTFLVTAIGSNTITINNTLGVSQSENSSVTNAYTTLWVSGGDGGIATSVNGTSWTLSPNCPLYQVNSVAYNGYIWVAVGKGNNHSIATSVDGATWFIANVNTNPLSFSASAIAWNRSLWVAVGYSSTDTIATSVDGVNWTGRGNTSFLSGGTMVVYTGTQWIAGGNGTNPLVTSTDGITWTPINNVLFNNPVAYANKTVSRPYTGYSSQKVLDAINAVITSTIERTTSSVASSQQIAQVAADEEAAAAAAAAELAARNLTKATAAGYVVEFLYWQQTITAAYNLLNTPPAGNNIDSNIYNIDFTVDDGTMMSFLNVQALYRLLNRRQTDILNYYTRILDDTIPQSILDTKLDAISLIRDEYNEQLVAFFESSRLLYDSVITTVKTYFDNYSFSTLLANYGFTSGTSARQNNNGTYTSISDILSSLNTYWANHISTLDSTYSTAHSVFTTPINSVSITNISAPTSNNIQTITVSSIGGIVPNMFVTITNAANQENNNVKKVLNVVGNTFTILNEYGLADTTATCQYITYNIGVQNAKLVGITDINDSSLLYSGTMTITITNFSAPSNGIQTLTTSQANLLYIGGQLSIIGSSSSVNNGTRFILSIGNNTVTVTNSSGVSSSGSATATVGPTSVVKQISTNAPNLAATYNGFDYADALFYYTTFNTVYNYKVQADTYYNNSIAEAIKWASTITQSSTLSITSFSAPSSGIQTITASSIGSLQVNSVITISGATNSLNNKSSPVLVLGISGNTFTISNPTGVSGTSQSATGTYSTGTVPKSTIDNEFNDRYYSYYYTFYPISAISTELGYTPYYTTDIPLKYFKLSYSHFTHPYTYPNEFSVLYSELQAVVNYADYVKSSAIAYANSKFKEVLDEKNYFEEMTRQSYDITTFTIQNHLLSLLNLLFYNDSNYKLAYQFLDKVRIGDGIYPDLYPLLDNIDDAIAIAEADGCLPNQNGWGGTTAITTTISRSQVIISNSSAVSETTNDHAIYATIPLAKVTTFGAPNNTFYQLLIFETLLDYNRGYSSLKSQADIVITGSSISGNNIQTKIVSANATAGGNSGLLIYNPTGVSISGENAIISATLPVDYIENLGTTARIVFKDGKGFTLDDQFKVTIAGAVNSGNNITNASIVSIPTSLITSLAVPGAQQGLHGWDYYNDVYYAYQKLSNFKTNHTEGNFITFTKRPKLTITGASDSVNNGTFDVSVRGFSNINSGTNGFTILNANGVSASGQSATGTCTFLISFISDPNSSNIQTISGLPFCLQVNSTITITGSVSSGNNVTNATITSVDNVNGTFTIVNSGGSVDSSGKACAVTTVGITAFGSPTTTQTIDMYSNIVEIGSQFITVSNNTNLTAFYGFYPYTSGRVVMSWNDFIDFSNNTTYDDIKASTVDFLTEMNTVTSNNGFSESYMNGLRNNDVSAIVSEYASAGQTYLNELALDVATNNPFSDTLLISAFGTASGDGTQILYTTGIGSFMVYDHLQITGASNSSNNIRAFVTEINGNQLTIKNLSGVAATGQTATGTYGDAVNSGSKTINGSATLGSMVNTINTTFTSLQTLKNTGITSTTNQTVTITGFSSPGYNQTSGTYTQTSTGKFIDNSTLQTVTVSSIGSIVPFVTIRITGASNASNNGRFKIFSVNGNTFTISNSLGVSASGQSATGTYSPVDVILSTAEGYVTTIKAIQNSTEYKQLLVSANELSQYLRNKLNIVTKIEKNLARWSRMKQNALAASPYPIGDLSTDTGEPFIMSIPPSQSDYWTQIYGTPFVTLEDGMFHSTTFPNGICTTVDPYDVSKVEAYSSTGKYNKYSRVSYQGDVYVCIADLTDPTLTGIMGVTPDNTDKWKQIHYECVTNADGEFVEASPDTFPLYDSKDFLAYNSTTPYKYGDLVSDSENVYRCIYDFSFSKKVVNVPPDVTSYYWLNRTYTVVEYNGKRVEADTSLFPTFSTLASAPAYDNSSSYSRGDCVTFGNPTKYYILTVSGIGPQSTNYPVTDVWREIIFPDVYDGGISYSLGQYLSYNGNYYFLFLGRQGKTIRGIVPGNYISSEDYWIQITHPVVRIGNGESGYVNVDSGSFNNYIECKAAANIPALNINNYSDYSSTKNYSSGDYVKYNGIIYECYIQQLSTIAISISNTTYWERAFYPIVTYYSSRFMSKQDLGTQAKQAATGSDTQSFSGTLPIQFPSSQQPFVSPTDTPGVTMEYAEAAVDLVNPNDYPVYSDSTVYNKNDIVAYTPIPIDGSSNVPPLAAYLCIDDVPSTSISNIPPDVPKFWMKCPYPLVATGGAEIPADPASGNFVTLNELDFHEYENNWHYYKGDIVSYQGNIYTCTNVNPENSTYADTVTGVSPLSSTKYWTDITGTSNSVTNILTTYFTPNNISVWDPNKIISYNGSLPSVAKSYIQDSFVVWKGLVYQCQQDITYPLRTYRIGTYYDNDPQNYGVNYLEDEAAVISLSPPNNSTIWKLVNSNVFNSPTIPPFYSNTYEYGSGSVVLISDFPSFESPGYSIQIPYRLRIFQLTDPNGGNTRPVEYAYPESYILDETDKYGDFLIADTKGTYKSHNVPRYDSGQNDPFALYLFAGNLKRSVINTIILPYKRILHNTTPDVVQMVLTDGLNSIINSNDIASYIKDEATNLVGRANTVVTSFNSSESDSIQYVLKSAYGDLLDYLKDMYIDIKTFNTNINTIKLQYFNIPPVQQRIYDDPYPYINPIGLAQDPPELYFKDLGVGDIDEISKAIDEDHDTTNYTEEERSYYYTNQKRLDDYNIEMQKYMQKMRWIIGQDLMAAYKWTADARSVGVDFVLPIDDYGVVDGYSNFYPETKFTLFITGESDCEDSSQYGNNNRVVDNGPRILYNVGSITSADIHAGVITFSTAPATQSLTIGLSNKDKGFVSCVDWLSAFSLTDTDSKLIVGSNKDSNIYAIYNIQTITTGSTGTQLSCTVFKSNGTIALDSEVFVQYAFTGDIEDILSDGSSPQGLFATASGQDSILGIMNEMLLASSVPAEYTLKTGPAAALACALTYESKDPTVKGIGKFAKGLVAFVAAGFQNAITGPMQLLQLVVTVGNLAATGSLDGKPDESTPFGKAMTGVNSVMIDVKFPDFAARAASINKLKGAVNGYKYALRDKAVRTVYTLAKLLETRETVTTIIIEVQDKLEELKAKQLAGDKFVTSRTQTVTRSYQLPAIPGNPPVKFPTPPVSETAIAIDSMKTELEDLTKRQNDLIAEERKLNGQLNKTTVKNEFRVGTRKSAGEVRAKIAVQVPGIENVKAPLVKPRPIVTTGFDRAGANTHGIFQSQYTKPTTFFPAPKPPVSPVSIATTTSLVDVTEFEEVAEARRIQTQKAEVEIEARKSRLTTLADEIDNNSLKSSALSKQISNAEIENLQRDLRNQGRLAQYEEELSAAQERLVKSQLDLCRAKAQRAMALNVAGTAKTVAEADASALRLKNIGASIDDITLTVEGNVATLTYKNVQYTQEILQVPPFVKWLRNRMPASFLSRLDAITGAIQSVLTQIENVYKRIVGGIANRIAATTAYKAFAAIRGNIRTVSKLPSVMPAKRIAQAIGELPLMDIAMAGYQAYSMVEAGDASLF